MRKKFFKIFLLILCVLSLLSCSSVFASAEEIGTEQELTQEEEQQVLVLGNSMSHYHNFPEVFSSMVKAGTGKEPEPTLISYSGRPLKDHASAIEAVIRTEGNSDLLTEQEKKYFINLQDKESFSQVIFDGYTNRIWDQENHRTKRFGLVILQAYYQFGRGEATDKAVADTVTRLIRALDSPSTKYVVLSSTPTAADGLKTFIKTQGVIDEAVYGGVDLVKEDPDLSGKYLSLDVSPYGRAFCNYLIQYGETYAQKIEPEAYDVYTAHAGWAGIVNDIMMGDNIHSTHLGTYISAATLYSVLYGDPRKTVEDYRGSVHGSAFRIDEFRIPLKGNCALAYRDGNGFRSKKILRRGAEIAWKTQKEGLRLSVDSMQKPTIDRNAFPILRKMKKVSDGINISWKVMDGAVKYRVFRKTNSGTWKAIGETRGISFFDKKIKKGHTYTYSVRCINEAGTKYRSKMDPVGLRYDYYSTPVLRSVKNTGTGVRIRWKKCKGVRWYRVIRKEGSGNWKALADTKSTDFTDTTAVSGKKYTYSVRCISKDRSRYICSYDKKGLSIRYR